MTSKLKRYMFDTNIFDRILAGQINLSNPRADFQLYATHIQKDEIKKCADTARRRGLLTVFNELPSNNIPTESTVLGVSCLGCSKLGGGDLFGKLRKNDPDDTEDALIAETCIANNITLVTEDKKLINRVRANGGVAIDLDEFRTIWQT